MKNKYLISVIVCALAVFVCSTPLLTRLFFIFVVLNSILCGELKPKKFIINVCVSE